MKGGNTTYLAGCRLNQIKIPAHSSLPKCSFYPMCLLGALTHLFRMSAGVISLSGQMYLMMMMAVTYQVPTTLRKLPERMN